MAKGPGIPNFNKHPDESHQEAPVGRELASFSCPPSARMLQAWLACLSPIWLVREKLTSASLGPESATECPENTWTLSGWTQVHSRFLSSNKEYVQAAGDELSPCKQMPMTLLKNLQSKLHANCFQLCLPNDAQVLTNSLRALSASLLLLYRSFFLNY